MRRHRGASAIAEDARRRLDSGGLEELALAEAEVGFRAALKVWPDNAVALRGVADVALARVELALGQGAVERAKALLAAFPDAPADLIARVEAASEQQLVDASRTATALKQVYVAYDSRRRRVVLAIYAPLWLSGWLLFAVATPETAAPIAWFLGGCFVLGVVVAAAQGAATFGSQAHRTNVLGGDVVLLVATSWAATCVRLDLPVVAAYVGVMLAQVVAFGLVAVSYDRRAVIPAITCLVCAVLSGAAPSGAPWFAVVMAAGVGLVTTVENLRAGRRRAQRGDDAV